MADYSGDVHTTYAMRFDPKHPYFWSGKVFSESTTSVPKEYYQFLLDLYADFCKRQLKNGYAVKKARITFDPKKETWVLHGHGLSWDKDKVEKYFGWPDGCTHANVHRAANGKYDFCMSCSKRFCEHTGYQTRFRKGGVEDPDWLCEDCGGVVND